MSKYNIEGGVDFFTELYKSLDIDENEQKTDEDQNLCLISSQQLTDTFFQMNCGHKFNYVPLYNDIKNHKQKYNGFEHSGNSCHLDEIRCPYCRAKQSGVLPYYEELGLEKLHGINYIDPNYHSVNSSSMYYKTCQFITPNPKFDQNSSNIIVETSPNNSGNCKFFTCPSLGTQLNYYHGMVGGINYDDDKFYCYSHKKIIIKKHKKNLIEKERAKIKEAKRKEKEEAKLLKKKEKDDAKEEKRKAKILAKNVVLGPSIIGHGGCSEILKSGLNKGFSCGGKIHSGNMCRRHAKKISDL